ncbi:MAG: glycosyltransferase family 39 protein [Anaerolineales bacterium]|nr:glycosyltransferase family 39 protein [Anaerolineales bacterium]
MSKRLSIVSVLLIHLALRLHNLTIQVPHIDEGFHVSRALLVWHFEQNPGRFMHGKLLLYYWVGLFDPQPMSGLWVARASIAIFSIITAATLYQIGRTLSNHWGGLLTVSLYAVMPYAIFFERMAMADPLAAGFAALVGWRSLVFARHPSYRQGAILGVLIALASMSKLTMAPVALVPVFATIGHVNWRRRILPPLIVAACIVIVAWMPIMLPAAYAHLYGDPFRLVSENNLQQLDSASPIDELQRLYPQIADLSGHLFWVGLVLVVGMALWCGYHRARIGWLLAWIGAVVLFSLLFSNRPRPRYFMPAIGPTVVLVAVACTYLWRMPPLRVLVRSTMIAGLAVWSLTFALPFIQALTTDPLRLNLSPYETQLYLVGTQSGPAIEQAVRLIESQDPRPSIIYTNWGTCQSLYFYTTLDIGCLESANSPVEVLQHPVTYIIRNGDERGEFNRYGVEWVRLGIFERQGGLFTVEVWRATTPSHQQAQP